MTSATSAIRTRSAPAIASCSTTRSPTRRHLPPTGRSRATRRRQSTRPNLAASGSRTSSNDMFLVTARGIAGDFDMLAVVDVPVDGNTSRVQVVSNVVDVNTLYGCGVVTADPSRRETRLAAHQLGTADRGIVGAGRQPPCRPARGPRPQRLPPPALASRTFKGGSARRASATHSSCSRASLSSRVNPVRQLTRRSSSHERRAEVRGHRRTISRRGQVDLARKPSLGRRTARAARAARTRLDDAEAPSRRAGCARTARRSRARGRCDVRRTRN